MERSVRAAFVLSPRQAPGTAKAVIGLWVDAGSRFEEPNESGSTNLIQRLALQSKDVESVNGWGQRRAAGDRPRLCLLLR